MPGETLHAMSLQLDQEAASTAKRAKIEQAVREGYESGGDARLWAKIEQL